VERLQSNCSSNSSVYKPLDSWFHWSFFNSRRYVPIFPRSLDTRLILLTLDMIFILTTVVLSLPVVLVGIYDVPFTVQELVRKAQHYNQHRHRRFDWRKKLLFWVSATLHSIVILIAVLAFFPNENPLVQGKSAMVIGIPFQNSPSLFAFQVCWPGKWSAGFLMLGLYSR